MVVGADTRRNPERILSTKIQIREFEFGKSRYTVSDARATCGCAHCTYVRVSCVVRHVGVRKFKIRLVLPIGPRTTTQRVKICELSFMPSTPDTLDGSGDTDGCVERGDPAGAGAERERGRETAFKDSEGAAEEAAEEAAAPLSRRLQRAMSSSLSSLSSLVDFAGIVSAVRDEDTELREGQRAKALDMLQHASMIVQMENEEFMAEFTDVRGSTSASASGRVEEVEVGDAEGGGLPGPGVGSSGAPSPSPSRDDEVSSYLPGKADYAGVWPVFSRQFWLDSIILIVLGGVLGLALVLTSDMRHASTAPKKTHYSRSFPTTAV